MQWDLLGLDGTVVGSVPARGDDSKSTVDPTAMPAAGSASGAINSTVPSRKARVPTRVSPACRAWCPVPRRLAL